MNNRIHLGFVLEYIIIMAKLNGVLCHILILLIMSSGYFSLGLFDLEFLKHVQEITSPFTKEDSHIPKEKEKLKDRSISPPSPSSGFGKGDQNEMSGFLGIGSLIDPIINLKKEPPGSPPPEVACVRTRFMHPFRDPIFFLGNGSIMTRQNPVCTWNMIGTEVCIPKLNCPFFVLDNKIGNCEEYLEIYDGHRGYAKFCGNNPPVNITAGEGLRDLYIKFQSTKWEGPDNPDLVNILKFNCTISCDGQDQRQPLPQVRKPIVNPFCSCGKKFNMNKIINGLNASLGEFPWLASLVQTNTRQPFCGGALINDRFILTAAHCIKGMFMDIKNLEIILNGQIMDQLSNSLVQIEQPLPKIYDDETLTKLDSGNNSIRFSVEEIILHPLYVTETNDFDVALLRLPKTVSFADDDHKLIPTCLPELGSYLRTYSKMSATIAGWGLTEPEGAYTSSILKKLVVNVIPPQKCKILYAYRINRRMLCAGYESGGRDSCMGDSGGPLVTEERPQVWYQIGVVSWGEGCASKKNPGVYIRTTETGQWVNHHSNINDAVWCSVPP